MAIASASSDEPCVNTVRAHFVSRVSGVEELRDDAVEYAKTASSCLPDSDALSPVFSSVEMHRSMNPDGRVKALVDARY